MALLSTVRAVNLKGYDFLLTLGKVNMIVGENGSGKTARLAAIRLALLGYEPKLGTQPISTWDLAGPDSTHMSVEAATDLGTIGYSWNLKSGKVIVTRKGLDSFPSLPKVLFDSREFFGLKTSASRSKFIFESYKIGDGDTSATSLTTKLKQITIEKMTDAHTKALEEIIETVMDSARTRNLAIKSGEDQPFQKWLAETGVKIKEIEATAKATYQRMTKSIEATTQLQAGDQQQVFRPLEAIKDELAKLRDAISKLAEEEGGLRRKAVDKAAKQKRRTELESELANLKLPDAAALTQALALLDAAPTALKLLIIQGGDLRSKYEEVQKKVMAERRAEKERELAERSLSRIIFDEAELAKLKAEIGKLQKHSEGYSSKVSELTKSLDFTIKNIADLQERSIELAGDIAKKEATMVSVLEKDCCPTCTSTGDAWKEAYRATMSAELTQMRSRANDIAKSLLEKQFNESTLRNDLAAAMTADDLHRAILNTLTEKSSALSTMETARTQKQQCEALLHSLGAPCLEALETESTEMATALDKKNAEIFDLENLIGAAKLIKSTADYGATTRARLEELKDSDDNDYAALLAKVEERRKLREQEFQTASTELQKATEAQQDEMRKAQSNAELDSNKAKAEIAKLALKTVQEFQQQVVDGVFKQLITTANTMVGSLLPSPLEYRDGDIGRMKGTKFVLERTFCGLDEVMTFVAFSVALAPDSPFKLVIMDEMGNLSPKNQMATLEKMHELTEAGIIHQFVGATPSDLRSGPPWLNIIPTISPE